MAEIKLTEGYDAQIAALKAAGDTLAVSSAASVSTGGLSLTTAEKYVEQNAAIGALLAEYRALILKDTADLQTMAEQVRATDRSIASGI